MTDEHRTILVRSCGHELDVTNLRKPWPEVGEYVACMSSCDRVPGRGPSSPRTVKAYRTESR